MLAKIRVQGFKCFECEELTLKNLNLFTEIIDDTGYFAFDAAERKCAESVKR